MWESVSQEPVYLPARLGSNAKKNGYLTLAITGNLQSKITENTDISVHLLGGR